MSELPPEGRVWNLMHGALAARALGIVADLHIADALAGGPRPVEDVAREVGADADTLNRLLRALAAEGIFSEESPGVYGNNDAAEFLRSGGLDDFAHLFGGVWHRTVGELEPTGEPSFPRLHGTDFWSWLAAHPQERAAFDGAMTEGKRRRTDRFADFAWRGDETVVDVGGGNGSLLATLLADRPGLRGIVYDLPETVRDEDALGERIEFVEGSFFDRVPAGDVYILGTILHDWPDEQALAILQTIRRCAPSQARVAILDAVLAPGNEPHWAKWLDLLMLALFGGRERTEPEWRALLSAAGLRLDAIQDGLIQASCP